MMKCWAGRRPVLSSFVQLSRRDNVSWHAGRKKGLWDGWQLKHTLVQQSMESLLLIILSTGIWSILKQLQNPPVKEAVEERAISSTENAYDWWQTRCSTKTDSRQYPHQCNTEVNTGQLYRHLQSWLQIHTEINEFRIWPYWNFLPSAQRRFL